MYAIRCVVIGIGSTVYILIEGDLKTKLCHDVVRHLLPTLLLQHDAQAAAEGGGERRRYRIPNLPVTVVYIASELEVVWETLQTLVINGGY